MSGLGMAAVACLMTLPQVANAQGATKPATVAAQAAPSNAATSAAQIEDLRNQIDKAERDKAIAEAKNEVIAAGSSRLEILIGAFSILITVLLGGFAFATYRQAGAAAAKAASDEFQPYKAKMDDLLKEAEHTTGKIASVHVETVELSQSWLANLSQLPGTVPNASLPSEQKAELAKAAQSANETPREQRTAQEFRLLMLQAASDEKWRDFVELAEGMAYLHGDNPDDLAFALFGKAYGQMESENFELSGNLWEDYFQRRPVDNSDRRAAALHNWGTTLLIRAKTTQAEVAYALSAAASEKFAAGLAINPNMHEALVGWGTALLVQAAQSAGEKRAALLSQAEEKCLRAEALVPGFGAYNLACVQSLRKDAAGAADWLRRAYKKNILFPGCATVVIETDFDSVRDSPEFQAALADIGC
jgi:hypothetical protein